MKEMKYKKIKIWIKLSKVVDWAMKKKT